MTTMVDVLFSTLDPIDQLLGYSCVHGVDEDNFLSTGLLKAKRSILELLEIKKHADYDNQRPEENSTDLRQVLVTADAIIKKILLAAQTAYQIGGSAQSGSTQGAAQERQQEKTLVDELRAMMVMMMPERNGEVSDGFVLGQAKQILYLSTGGLSRYFFL